MPESPTPKLRPGVPGPDGVAAGRSRFAYAELDAVSNFSFLRGASHPDELVYRAAELGYRAIAITDVNSLAGVVRAHEAARQSGMKLVVGARLELEDGPDLLAWPTDRAAYGRLCRLLTLGKRRAEKAQCLLRLEDVLEHERGLQFAISDLPLREAKKRRSDEATKRGEEGTKARRHEGTEGRRGQEGTSAEIPSAFTQYAVRDTQSLPIANCKSQIANLRDTFGRRLSLAVSALYTDDDVLRLGRAFEVSKHYGIPLLATNHVHYHDPSRRVLQDVLTCVRHGCTIPEAGLRLFPNGERYLKSPEQMHRLFADYPRALARTIEVAEACTFSLDELRYEYPDEVVPAGQTALEYLSELAWRGAAERYPQGIPDNIRSLIARELVLIAELKFEPYFLTVYDLVKFARSRGILCQGRGSAANSAVCYCLGVTSVDPSRIDLLFERFVSAARGEPPDIDIDFEHERREEVLQYIYSKYGRERAGMTAEVITYRGRSAIRDVGKALGLSLDMVDQMAKKLDWWERGTIPEDRLRECGLDPADRTVRQVIDITTQFLGFPRHLSQHVGGMVMTRGPLCELVPIENAAMADRTVIEWDKDDIDALGILKVDCLGLGMLTCISKAISMLNGGSQARRHEGTVARRGEEGERDEVGSDAGIEARRHEDAKARRGEEGKRDEVGEEGGVGDRAGRRLDNGRDSDSSRSDRLAEGDAVGANGVSGNGSNAGIGAIWPDKSDEEGGRLDSLEYRRGIRETDDHRLHQVPSTGSRITGRAVDADRNRDLAEHAGTSCPVGGSACGDRSCAAGTDPQPGDQAVTFAQDNSRSPTSLNPSASAATSCLRAFVPSCLRAFVPSCLGVRPLELHTIPPEDPAVYDMISDADTVGVFQIESRAQMSMLPRLRPRNFYDLVIEVAIVRPGPIQGDMVHPYLRRRNGEEPITYPSPQMRQVLAKTLGVPLFQEQAMRLAIVGAGFTPAEADQLRRAMAAWKRHGGLGKFRDKFVNGMLANGYPPDFTEQCFKQLHGFSEYGFPESHAASFALLVYASAWIKRHHPAAFCAALLNSQPMGFYAPAQIIRDARQHGVEVRPVDVNHSEWDCTLEYDRHEGTKARRHEGVKEVRGSNLSDKSTWGQGGPGVRLGFRQLRGFKQVHAERLVEARRRVGRFATIDQLQRIAQLPVVALRQLAEADAFGSIGLSRRHALWQVMELKDETAPLFEAEATERRSDEATKGGENLQSAIADLRLEEMERRSDDDAIRNPTPQSQIANRKLQIALPSMPIGQEVMLDYLTAGVSLKRHPVSLLREDLKKRGATPADVIQNSPANTWVRPCGLVLIRQRPSTASGIVFVTLEDETGIVNLIVRPHIYDRYRAAARHAGLLQAEGYVERQGQVVHVMVKRLFDLSYMLSNYNLRSRDFH